MQILLISQRGKVESLARHIVGVNCRKWSSHCNFPCTKLARIQDPNATLQGATPEINFAPHKWHTSSLVGNDVWWPLTSKCRHIGVQWAGLFYLCPHQLKAAPLPDRVDYGQCGEARRHQTVTHFGRCLQGLLLHCGKFGGMKTSCTGNPDELR